VHTFEELSVPVEVACTDLISGRGLRISNGELLPAVLGSCIPAGLFAPVQHRGLLLVDGGYSDPVPLPARNSGETILVLDGCVVPTRLFATPATKNLNAFHAGRRAFDSLVHEIVLAKLNDYPAIVIRPELDSMTFIDFSRAHEAISAGRRAMELALPTILKTQ
jgi:NTE family protein